VGRVTGLRARGGFDVSMSWEAGRLIDVDLVSEWGQSCRIQVGERVVPLETDPGGRYHLDEDLVLTEG
jgi:alpha-L-fucosidase 2